MHVLQMPRARAFLHICEQRATAANVTSQMEPAHTKSLIDLGVEF